MMEARAGQGHSLGRRGQGKEAGPRGRDAADWMWEERVGGARVEGLEKHR